MDINDFDSLISRLDDLKRCATRGSLGVSAFFSPRELRAAEEYLCSCGADFLLYGGYLDAERKKVYILPEFAEDCGSADELLEYGYSTELEAFLIRGSGFERITHRDVLGSLLGLGVERDVLGDIIMIDDSSAVVICDAKLVSFFESGLSRVGRDTVKIKRISIDELILPERKTAPISDTVASPRLDCVVAALCSISRERAKERILASTVELDYATEERPDREVVAPTVLSIRGVGKFKVLSVCERTKKGRLRLLAEKYL